MKLFITLLSIIWVLLFLCNSTISAQDYEKMLMDDGGSTTGGGSTIPIDNQVKKIKTDVMRDIINNLLKNRGTTVIPVPTSIPIPTNSSGQNNTDPPDPGYTPTLPANSDETQYADSVVSTIRQNCFSNPTTRTGAGIVNYINRDCLKSLASIMNQRGIDEHYASPNNSNSLKPRYYLQCVACARGMSDARNRDYDGYGDAAQHIGINGVSNVAGYTYYTNTPTNYQHLIPGSLGISNQNHIWYITDVKRDTGGTPIEVRAYECNFGGKGLVRHDNSYRVTSAYFTGWQKPN